MTAAPHIAHIAAVVCAHDILLLPPLRVIVTQLRIQFSQLSSFRLDLAPVLVFSLLGLLLFEPPHLLHLRVALGELERKGKGCVLAVQRKYLLACAGIVTQVVPHPDSGVSGAALAEHQVAQVISIQRS